MAILPDGDLEQIQFCESHLSPFNTNAVAIGISVPMVTALTALTTKARAAYNAALAARLASKAATQDFHASTSDMADNVRDLLVLIKAKAETTNNPNVYTLAQIPPPAAPVPAELPSKPSDFIVTLESDGSLTLRWKSTNSTTSSGVFFQVQRKLPGQTTFTNIGGTPIKEFNDATIPSSGGGASYIVTGYRGTRAGKPSDQLTVQFGVGGDGVSVTNGTFKMAA